MKLRAVVAVFLSLAFAAGAGPSGALGAEPGRPLVERVKVGAYVHLDGKPYRDPVAPEDLRYLEDRIGKLDIVHYFFSWGRGFNEAVSSNVTGRDLMLSMKPDGDLVWQIRDGRQDAYINRFAADARAYGRPVYLRFGHEMNGQWMSYSAGRDGGPSAADFKTAWRRVVDRFRAQGATNVKFVWSPNESDFPDRSGNRMEDYWPGPGYVDIAGFDAYNWTNAEPRRGDGANRSFEQVVEAPYDRISRITDKEIWLCEFGTVEPDKAGWIRNMFASTRFPRLTGLIYFSENDQRDVQRDWRIDSSATAAQAWRAGIDARGATTPTSSAPVLPTPTSSAPVLPTPTSSTPFLPTSSTPTSVPPANPKPATDQVVNLPAVSATAPFSQEIVRALQALLTSRGFPVPADGTFSASTETAVRSFQQSRGIRVTGVVDSATWSRLIYG